jgi:hypothetical protein
MTTTTTIGLWESRQGLAESTVRSILQSKDSKFCFLFFLDWNKMGNEYLNNWLVIFIEREFFSKSKTMISLICFKKGILELHCSSLLVF